MAGTEPDATTADICLVVPPFESLHHPNLGTAILKSACAARGLSTRIVYGGLMLAARVGHERYDADYESPMRLKVGERLFRAHAYPPGQAARLPEPEPLRPDLEQLEAEMAPAIEPARRRSWGRSWRCDRRSWGSRRRSSRILRLRRWRAGSRSARRRSSP